MFLRKGPNRLFYLYSLFLLFIPINPQWYPVRTALQNARWSPPQTIPLYDPEALPPVLVADQNRTVHAFSSQWLSGKGGESAHAIIYNRWTLQQGWTAPVDIILSPYKEARILDVRLDRTGIFHVVFFGGDFTNANIYYSKAPAAIADNAQVWSMPSIIGENAGDPAGAKIEEDDQGTLYVVYYGRALGNGLYVVNSADGGKNWSDSSSIFFAQIDAPNISLLDVIESESGSFHAVWGVYNAGGQGRGIYYARSEDGIEWGEPILLASAEEGLGTHTPAIIEHDGVIFVFYSGITMRQSFDNGLTWSDPVKIFPRHTGINGTLSPIIDGNNVLHLFFGQRISGSPDIHGMWHSIFMNNRWTEPEAVVKGPRIVDTVGFTGFDPYDARAVVSQGNVILVTWRTDPGDIRDNGIWFSYAVINAPELPLATLQPFVKNNTTPSSSPSPSLVPTLVANDTSQIPFDKDRQVQTPLGWLVMAVVTVGILGVFYMLSRHDH